MSDNYGFDMGEALDQISWAIAYINMRYGSVENMLDQTDANNWYDRGGWLPGSNIAVNDTGEDEGVDEL